MRSTAWTLCPFFALLGASMPTLAAAPDPVSDSIPTMLVGTIEPTHYPDPICSKCSILVSEDEQSDGSRADIHIAYPVDAPRFIGDIEVTVGLRGGSRRVLWLSDLTFEPGDERELVAVAAMDWSWADTEFVWLRFVPR